MPTSAAAVPPIVAWFQLYGNIIFFVGQLIWWLVTGFAAGWAACIYYRSFKMKKAAALAHAEAAADKEARTGFPAASKASDDKKADDKKAVDVDKFVE